jgi:hypothetical protein
LKKKQEVPKNVYGRSLCTIEPRSKYKKKIFLPYQKSRGGYSYTLIYFVNKKATRVIRGRGIHRFSTKAETVSPEICILGATLPMPRDEMEELIYI